MEYAASPRAESSAAIDTNKEETKSDTADVLKKDTREHKRTDAKDQNKKVDKDDSRKVSAYRPLDHKGTKGNLVEPNKHSITCKRGEAGKSTNYGKTADHEKYKEHTKPKSHGKPTDHHGQSSGHGVSGDHHGKFAVHRKMTDSHGKSANRYGKLAEHHGKHVHDPHGKSADHGKCADSGKSPAYEKLELHATPSDHFECSDLEKAGKKIDNASEGGFEGKFDDLEKSVVAKGDVTESECRDKVKAVEVEKRRENSNALKYTVDSKDAKDSGKKLEVSMGSQES